MQITLDKKKMQIDKGTTADELLKKLDAYKDVLCYKVNNEHVGRSYVFRENDEVTSLTIKTDEGYLIYKETLILVLLSAADAIFDCAPVIVRQSVNKSTYFELAGNPVKEEYAAAIKEKMKEIIARDEPPVQFETDIDTAAKLFKQSGAAERAQMLYSLPVERIKLCKAGERYHITYQDIAYSISSVENFDITTYEKGYLLRYPTNYSDGKIPNIPGGVKIHNAIRDYRDWIETIGVKDIFSLNDIIKSGRGSELVNLSEGLHEKRISMMADCISSRPEIKIVLIAGPSSSGKTTFANRLKLHLRINHLSPVVISLDDYYVDNERMPRNQKGETDFEMVEAIDYELFNKHLALLAAGEAVQLPKYDFKKKKRVEGPVMQLSDGQIIIAEGIHALNELLTSRVDKKNKYKIYLSALTSLCLDEYNVFSPTDNRLLRRIVRDAAYRASDAEETLSLWKNVRKGELKYIFPFESEADEVFNSSLVYELSVLREPAMSLLKEVGKDSPHYSRAKRLTELLSYFYPMESSFIPPTSIIREFIGGSTIL